MMRLHTPAMISLVERMVFSTFFAWRCRRC
jgi:hypothetical protein